MWGEYVDFFEDQLYWLAHAVDDSSERLRLDILERIVRSNREVASGVAQMYRWSAKLPSEVSTHTDNKKAHLLRLAALLDKALGGDEAPHNAST